MTASWMCRIAALVGVGPAAAYPDKPLDLGDARLEVDDALARLELLNVLEELRDVLAVAVADHAVVASRAGPGGCLAATSCGETCDSWRSGGGLISRALGTVTS